MILRLLGRVATITPGFIHMAETKDKADTAVTTEGAEATSGAEPENPQAGLPAEATEESETDHPTPLPGQPFEIPVLALQNTTLFPETVVPLAVGRPRSVAAVEAALSSEEKLLT